MSKIALTAARASQWAQRAHVFFLDALMQHAGWGVGELAFHGGTSLHLSWRSARYSEDLDFLLSSTVSKVDAVAAKVVAAVQERFRALDAAFSVELRDKSKDAARMLSFHVVVTHSGYLGRALVKAEFWRTQAGYLAQYPTVFRTPASPSDLAVLVSHPVPAATLETAYADKLVAFATRPRLKWRDIYDLWWIGTQSSACIDLQAVCTQFRHNLTAYQTVNGATASQALRAFLTLDTGALVSAADPELKRWLPPALWKSLHPQGVQEMVTYVRTALRNVADALDAADEQPS
jgi:predicted nucleotidyltransferase component of viral defense system